MEKAIKFLQARKISGQDWVFSEDYLLQTLSFTPDVKTSLKSIEKHLADFGLHMAAAGPASIKPIFHEGKIKISWVKEPITSQPLPIQPKPKSVPLGMLANGTHKSISLPLAPHIIVAGTTGSGKSYWMHGAIRWAISQSMHVFAVDPKMGEFGEYAGNNRFYHISNQENFIPTLEFLVQQMNSIYQDMSKAGVKNVNEWSMAPATVLCVIDELSDAVLTYGDKFLKPLILLAQKGRAAGIHIIAGTQTPTAKVLSGELKANFPVKIAFKTSNATASRVVLDQAGAENLLGAGDGLCIAENGELLRFKGYRLDNTIKVSKL